MKTNQVSKTALFCAWVIGAALIGTSCNNKNPETAGDSTEVAAKENDVKFDNKKQENDAQFLVDATAFDLEEILLAELARQKSNNADVQGLSKMMAEEHSKTLKEIRDLAKKKQITIPDSVTSDTRSTFDQLSAKTGDDFNKAYCDKLVEAHKKSVASFEKESADSRDQDIKEWATTKLTDLRKHVDHIFACQKKFEKK